MKKWLIPAYIEEFSCIGGACEDTCCASWKISLDKTYYEMYMNIEKGPFTDELKAAVKKNESSKSDFDYATFTKNPVTSKCSLLLDDGLCSIHKNLGEDFLCNTCAIYPKNFSEVGDMYEKSLTLSCPEAARVVLLKKEGIDFIETTNISENKSVSLKKMDLNQEPFFWDIRIFSIQLLQHREQPIAIRLIILGLFMQKINSLNEQQLALQLESIIEGYKNALTNEEFINSLYAIEGNKEFQMKLIQDLIAYRKTGSALTDKYKAVLEDMMSGFGITTDKDLHQIMNNYDEAIDRFYKPFMESKEYILENYLVNYVFKNVFPCDYTSKFESYIMIVVHYSLIKLHLIGVSSKNKEMNDELVIHTIQQVVKTIEHNPRYLQGVLQGMEKSGFATMGHMVSLIKN